MNRYQLLKTSTVVVGAILFGALAAAQGAGQGRSWRGGFGGGGNSFGLLRRSDVQADLQLSVDQKTKIQSLMDSMRGQRGDRGQGAAGGGTPPSDADREAMRQQMQARRAEMQKQLDSILTSDQTHRLKQISIQLRGNMAVLDESVQNDLGLSDSQKSKIKDLQQKMSDASQTLFQKMRDNSISREDAMTSFQKNNDIMKDELGKVLTDAQKDKLKELGGAPFKADPSESMGGFGGGFGRRGGRGGAGGGNVGG